MATSLLGQRAVLRGSGRISTRASGARRVRACGAVGVQAREAKWAPGFEAPKHLDGTLPADFGFDPLGLGVMPDRLKWFRESELVHSRWAMLGVAGILVQEIAKPDVFFYDAAAKTELPFDIRGVLAAEFLMMHFVENLRMQDFKKLNSVNQDPIFKGNKLPDHEPGYPGGVFAPFIPGDLEEMKVKELKNGRLAMVAFVGMIVAAQVTGKGPIANLVDHLASPMTNLFIGVSPGCAIPPSVDYQGITIPTPCLPLWPGA
eukprot:jgi/Pico_ML_1/52156/g2914.t1